MKDIEKKPDEVNSYEFLYKHLYEMTKKGGFEAEFTQFKATLPYLKRFERLIDLMILIEKDRASIPDSLLDDLVKLYQSRRDPRPTVIILVMLMLWKDLEGIYGRLPEKKYGGLDERFSDVYWHLLSIMKDRRLEHNTRPEIISRLAGKFKV
ncbi:MAG: hypothetical protein HZA49_11360 [Planctomycetes bacterium]|nr:hypothetical protein [Planctomycetota bacterium]